MFSYVACERCRSLYCQPMPNAEDLEAMYGPSYGSVTAPESIADPKEPEWVLDWLDRLPRGKFVDYGCGTGELLVEAARRGWDVLGVELVSEVVEELTSRTGLPIVHVETALERDRSADILHVGDVLEHLTNLEREMPRILSLLRPGGLLLAQGPLEANGNLFTWCLRCARSLKARRPSTSPPHHVILATVDGQWALFRRFGLTPVEEGVTEVFWPAPSRLSIQDLRHLRSVGLFTLRHLSRALSRARPARWGNRYRYAGRFAEHQILVPTAHQ